MPFSLFNIAGPSTMRTSATIASGTWTGRAALGGLGGGVMPADAAASPPIPPPPALTSRFFTASSSSRHRRA